MIKGVIFDMDGVIVDNRDFHIEAFQIFGRRYGVEVAYDTIMNVFGLGNDEILPIIFPANLLQGRDIMELGEEKEQIYREIFEKNIKPAEGLVDFLKDLQAKGYRTAIGSSAPMSNVDFVIQKCGLAQYFDVTVCGDMVEKCKPAPDIYLLATELLGFQPSECVVIEDALPGVKAARAAANPVIGIVSTFPRQTVESWGCDKVIGSFAEISADTMKSL